MRFNDMFDDAQSNPHPWRFPAQFRSATVEPFENLFVFIGRDAVAVILDPKPQGVGLAPRFHASRPGWV
jgi:hypothetical protein